MSSARLSDRRPDQPQPRYEQRGGGWRHGFRALRHRNYRLYWGGQLVSVIGTWMSTLALSWLVLELGASPFQLSLISAFQFGPILLFGLIGGVIADRFPKRTLLLLTQSGAALQAVTLTILVVTDTVQLWHVFALTVMLGLCNAVDMPTRQAIVSELVGPDDVVNAVALNSTVFNAGRVVGPAVAGMLLGSFGAAVCFGVNAASFLPIIAGLSLMRFPSRQRVAPSVSPFARLREGLAYVRSEPAVLLPIALVGFVGTFGLNFNFWIPLLAKDSFATGAGGFGVLMSALGIGSLVGALTLAFRRTNPSWSAALGTAMALGALELGLAAAGAARVHYLFALPILTGLGFTMSRTMAMANTIVQTTAPAALRGRVMSVYMTVFAGTLPIGGLVVGTVAQALGTPVSVALGGTIALVSALTIGFTARRIQSRQAQGASAVPRPASAMAAASSKSAPTTRE